MYDLATQHSAHEDAFEHALRKHLKTALHTSGNLIHSYTPLLPPSALGPAFWIIVRNKISVAPPLPTTSNTLTSGSRQPPPCPPPTNNMYATGLK